MGSLERSKSDVPARPPLMRRALAALVLTGAVAIGLYLVVHIILGVFMTIIWIAVALAVAVGVLWALKTIVW